MRKSLQSTNYGKCETERRRDFDLNVAIASSGHFWSAIPAINLHFYGVFAARSHFLCILSIFISFLNDRKKSVKMRDISLLSFFKFVDPPQKSRKQKNPSKSLFLRHAFEYQFEGKFRVKKNGKKRLNYDLQAMKTSNGPAGETSGTNRQDRKSFLTARVYFISWREELVKVQGKLKL